RESWVRGQYAYFRTRGYRLKRHADAISAHGLLLAASAPFVIVPVVLAFTSPAPLGAESALRTILLIASGLLPGIGSIMNELLERPALVWPRPPIRPHADAVRARRRPAAGAARSSQRRAHARALPRAWAGGDAGKRRMGVDLSPAADPAAEVTKASVSAFLRTRTRHMGAQMAERPGKRAGGRGRRRLRPGEPGVRRGR